MIVVRWLAVLVLAGCYAPAPQAGTPCSALGDCPTPLQCDRGVCVAVPGGGDAAIDTGDAPDGALIDAPPACSTPPSGPWSSAIMIDELQGPGTDGTPMMRADGLEMYWKSQRNGISLDIYRAVRPSTNQEWGTPIVVAEVNTAAVEGSPEVSPDGLTMYFSSNRPGSAQFDIYVSKRTSTNAAWSPPVLDPVLSTPGVDEGLMILPSQLVAYLHSDRDGQFRIFRTTRPTPSSAWDTPSEISELADGHYENPVVSADECRMYLQAIRNDTQGNGDLYLSTRAQPSGPWGAPVKLLPPSTPSFDADPWISADERYLMFTTGSTLLGLELHESVR
jgi:hypothetical protein